MYHRSGGVDPGRDGCRVPLPWSGATAPFGFSPAGAADDAVAAQPARWAALTVEAQAADPGSMLSLYRSMLASAGSTRTCGTADLPLAAHAPDGVLAFERGDRFVCLTNLSPRPRGPAGRRRGSARQRSRSWTGGLPADATAWLRAAPDGTRRQPRHRRGHRIEEEALDDGAHTAARHGGVGGQDRCRA